MSSCMVIDYLPKIECVGTSLNFLKAKMATMHTYFFKCPKIFHYLPIIPTANDELIWSLIEIHEGTSGSHSKQLGPVTLDELAKWHLINTILTPSNYVLYNRLVTPINHSNHFCWCGVSEELDIWPPYWNRCSEWKRREARVLTLMSPHSCSPKEKYLTICTII